MLRGSRCAEALGVGLLPLLAMWRAAHAETPMSYLSGAGARAYPVVGLTWGLIVQSVLVALVITVLVVWGVLARRSRGASAPLADLPVERRPGGLRWITIGIAASSVGLLASLVWTVVVLAQINQPPPGAVPFTIEVTGRQWWWDVAYRTADPSRSFRTANEIHIPTGRPVRFLIKGGDVIHSFWIPALGGKMDAIPGQTNVTWLEADHAGRYRGQCTEYCGLEHANMALFVVADPPPIFQAWWSNQLRSAGKSASPEAARGEQLVTDRCGSCHTVRGTSAGGTTAPDLTHLMTRLTIAAGAAPNTPAGLSGWVANPQGVKPGTLMPTLYLSGPQLSDVRAYLLTLD